MTKVKICGFKTFDEAKLALDAGADFLGLNFVPTSKRYIFQQDAKNIIQEIRNLANSKDAKIIGVFQNAPIQIINNFYQDLKLDGVQLHGEEPPDYCQKINSQIIIKALNLESDFDVEQIKNKMSQYTHVQYFLVDREIQGQGRHLNMQKVKTLSQYFKLFVGGGLNPDIIGQVVKTTDPFAVDVASGVETNGIKDPAKIRAFIFRAKKMNTPKNNKGINYEI